MSSGVQTSLDRSDRAVEHNAHFLQRLTVKVEGHQCAPVQIAETIKAGAQLLGVFQLHQLGSRTVRSLLQDFKRSWLTGRFRRTSDSSVDRQTRGDLAQPATKRLRFLQLRQLTKRSQENLLSHFVRFCRVAQPLHDDSVNASVKLDDQFTESLSVSGLSANDCVCQCVKRHDIRLHVWKVAWPP